MTDRLLTRTPLLPALALVLTEGQLLVAEFVPGIERFEGKAFGARLIAYPALMLLVPFLWWLVIGRFKERPAPWPAFALVMLPFLIDVTGNTLDLYDSVTWWDDANHFFNWLLLLTGIGLITCRDVRPRWAVVVAIGGLGALLAIGWELGEWYTFIRHGTERDTAYEDTLGDESLGSLGALVAGFVVAWWSARSPGPGEQNIGNDLPASSPHTYPGTTSSPEQPART